MNYIKLILIAVGLYLLVMLGFAVIGIVYSALWYLFVLGVIAIGGSVGYKYLKKKPEQPKLEEKTPVSLADTQDADRALEEYKRKYLSK
ncbi:MAG: hypothetical protein JWN60_3128 [Acidobacteria bacterium]|jgi:hypothetical protein|nr:hypothetical protein [Acidobacteriota bacterium]